MLKCSYSDLCACFSNTVGVLLAGSLYRFIISRYVWYSCDFKSGGEQQSQNKNNVAVSPSDVSFRLFSSSHLRLSVPAAGQLNLKGGCSRVKRFPFFLLLSLFEIQPENTQSSHHFICMTLGWCTKASLYILIMLELTEALWVTQSVGSCSAAVQ